MARHGSASSRKEASAQKGTSVHTETAKAIDADLKRRARLLLTNSSIPGRTLEQLPGIPQSGRVAERHIRSTSILDPSDAPARLVVGPHCRMSGFTF